MNASEYYIGIIAIFFSLSLAKFLEGVFEFWIKRKAINFFFIHVVWVAICFLGIFQYMWSVFPYMNEYIDENLINFILFLFPVVVFHVLCFFLFPDIKNFTTNNLFSLSQYFEANKTMIYLLAVLFTLSTQILVRIFPDPLENNFLLIVRAFISLLLIISIFYKNRKFDYFVSFTGLIIVLSFTCLTLAPNHTNIEVKIQSNSIQNREFIWKNCFVQINDNDTPNQIDINTGKVKTRELFKFGDKVKIKVINSKYTNIVLVQPIEYFNIEFNNEIIVNVNIK